MQQQPQSEELKVNIDLNHPKKKAVPASTEERCQQLFGTNTEFHQNIKRQREVFAIQLRKQRREDHYQAKRAHIVSQGPSCSSKSLLTPKLDAPLIDISIDQALSHVGKIDDQQFIVDVQKMLFKIDDFPRLVELIQNPNDLLKIFATIGLRRLLCLEMCPPIQLTINSSLVPVFVHFLAQRDDLPKLQFEAAWCLTNVASGTSHHVEHLLQNNTLVQFKRHLKSQYIEIQEQVIWGIGNIAGDSNAHRDLMIESGVPALITEALESKVSHDESFIRQASWALSNLCRGRPTPAYEGVKECIFSLSKILKTYNQSEIIHDICWAISYISDGGPDHCSLILQHDLVPRLMQLISSQALDLQISCLRAIGNCLTGSDSQTQQIINLGFLPQAQHLLLKSPKKHIRKEVCWSLSNITAGDSSQIQQLLDCGLIDQLCHSAKTDDREVRLEAVWALSNCTQNCTHEQMMALVGKDILPALFQLITFQEEMRIVMVALQGIENVLECGLKYYTDEKEENAFASEVEMCGGIDILEGLQTHNNRTIYEKAQDLLERYFDILDIKEYSELDVAKTPFQTLPFEF